MPIAHSDKLVSILREGDGFHRDGNLIGGNDVVVFPVPHVDQHVMLAANRDDILRVGRESLREEKENGKSQLIYIKLILSCPLVNQLSIKWMVNAVTSGAASKSTSQAQTRVREYWRAKAAGGEQVQLSEMQ